MALKSSSTGAAFPIPPGERGATPLVAARAAVPVPGRAGAARTCACPCGQALKGRQTMWASNACRMRAAREGLLPPGTADASERLWNGLRAVRRSVNANATRTGATA